MFNRYRVNLALVDGKIAAGRRNGSLSTGTERLDFLRFSWWDGAIAEITL